MSPSVVLAAYAEPLLDGRRVVVFGDATTDLGLELVERGARSVHVYDPEPARAALASNQNRAKEVTVVPLDSADIALRDGAFDVAIVPDLSGVPGGPLGPEALLRRVRRALSSRGTAIIASPNPDAQFTLARHTSGSRRMEPLGYYELYDAVAAVFDEVRMLGQTPFVGYAVVDFAPDEDPEVSLDSGLLPTGAEEPEWFVALAGNEAVPTDTYSIVQLPASRVIGGDTVKLESELRASKGREAELLERVSAIEARNDAEAASQAKAHADSLVQELADRDVRIERLETQLQAEGARATHAATEIDTLRKKASDEGASAAALSSLTHERAELSAKFSRLTAENEKLSRLAAENEKLSRLATENEKLSRLAAENEKLSRLAAENEKRLAAENEKLSRLAAENEKLSRLATENEKLSRLATENEKLSRLATENEKRLAAENEKLSRDLAAAIAQETAAQKALLSRDAEKARLEQSLAAAEARIAKLTAVEADGAPDDVSRLEAALEERASKLRQLEKDLREAERVGRELIRELKTSQAAGETRGVGAGDGEALGQENARLRADLEALSWTIQELEGRLSRAAAPVAR